MIVTKTRQFVRIVLEPDEANALLELLKRRGAPPECDCSNCRLQGLLEEWVP